MDERMPLPGAQQKINWYPGHMAKAKRLLAEQLSRVDLCVELCDARIPGASRNPDLLNLTAGKRRLLVLNKSDLADERATRAWLSAYRAQGEDCMAFDSAKGRAKDVTARVERACRAEIDRMAARGVRKTVRVLVVGIPNVGKSTFVNRIKGASIARTGDRPSVTKSNQWVRVTPWLELLDTPGLLWPNLADQEGAQLLCFTGTVSDRVTDTQALAIRLLERLMGLCPEVVSQRFHLREGGLRGLPLLEEACRGRGWILTGGIMDTERGAALVLDEFRGGKLGRITLEMPERAPAGPANGAPQEAQA